MPKDTVNIIKGDNQKLLVTWYGDYADEFERESFCVMTRKEYGGLIFELNKLGEISWSFGTNEEMTYDKGSELAKEISIVEISDSDAECLKKLFPKGFGDQAPFTFDFYSEKVHSGFEDFSFLDDEDFFD